MQVPTSPPSVPSAVDSARNCAAMCRGRAPTARRRPISSVRSSTATSVVFAIPTAPISRLTSARMRNRPCRSPLTSLCRVCGLDGEVTTRRLGSVGSSAAAICLATELGGADPGRDDHLGLVLVPDAGRRVAVVGQRRPLRDQHRALAGHHALGRAVDADDRVRDAVHEHRGMAGQAGRGDAQRGRRAGVDHRDVLAGVVLVGCSAASRPPGAGPWPAPRRAWRPAG